MLDFPKPFDLNSSVKLMQKVAQVLVNAGLYLFPITFFGIFLDQWLTTTLENEVMSQQGASGMVWLWGALSILLNLIYPLLALVVVLAALQKQNIAQFLSVNFAQSLKEQMRAWGKTVWWSLLLIIPGLIKFVQYSFVPFVVCLFPQYQKGEVDALKTSQKLVKTVIWRVLGVLVLFSIILPLLLSSFQEYRLFSLHPVSASVFAALEVIINVFAVCFIFDLFMRSAHESHVSMERS